MPDIPLIRDINLCEIMRYKILKAHTTKEQSILKTRIHHEKIVSKSQIKFLGQIPLVLTEERVLKQRRDFC